MSIIVFDPNETFDVIVVGAGPAGCVLASRLSEQSSQKVLLLDAGPDAVLPGAEHPDILDPFCLTASDNANFLWPGLQVSTRVECGRQAAPARQPYMQGYGVGGASNINGMGADRGQPGDYDEWCDLGAQGWSWEAVLPYFRKLERDLDFPDAAAMHGKSGPMPVRRLPRMDWGVFAAGIGAALQRRGFAFLEDYMGDFREGFSSVPTNSLADRRVSAPLGYLTQEVRRRRNLQIIAHARVDRLSLSGACANGVWVRVDDTVAMVRGRQVIVSCGAIQSPALLMRSGIGPAAQLIRHGIEPVRDLQGVGAHLQNHPCVTLATYLPREAMQAAGSRGFLQNWLRYSSGHPGCDPCDMHLMAFNKCAWHVLGRRMGAVTVSVLKPYSQGWVELASADPAAAPNVQFNLLADARDEERLVSGLRFALELLAERAVKSLHHEVFFPNERVVASLSPRTAWNGFRARAICRVLDWAPLRRALLASARIDTEKLLKDASALRDFVRSSAQVQYHVCGTCRMGESGDAAAVVDGAGRVHGVEGLRVIDASIFPTVPRGYTHFIVLMAAEKLADTVKSDWRVAGAGL